MEPINRVIRGSISLAFIGLAALVVSGNARNDTLRPTWHQTVCTLPVLAYLADVVGVGEVTESSSSGFRIVVDQYWVGNPGVITLDIAVQAVAPPIATEPIVFFGTTNAYFQVDELGFGEQASRWAFLTNRVVQLPSTALSLPLDDRSWFPAALDNGVVAGFASNLVYHARTQPDPHAFYQMVRDGGNTSATVSSRIYQDSVSTLVRWALGESEEYVMMMWNDPLLPDPVRAAIRFRFPDWE